VVIVSGLFNDHFNCSDISHIESNDNVISEQEVGNDVEGSGMPNSRQTYSLGLFLEKLRKL
jgi:hypothetical protein